MEEEQSTIYFIPNNYEISGQIFGMNIRRIIEGVILALIPALIIILIPLPKDVTLSLQEILQDASAFLNVFRVRLPFLIGLCGLSFAIGVMGVNDDNLSTFLYRYFLSKKTGKLYLYNKRTKLEIKQITEIERIKNTPYGLEKIREKTAELLGQTNEEYKINDELIDTNMEFYFEDDEGIVDKTDSFLSPSEKKIKLREQKRKEKELFKRQKEERKQREKQEKMLEKMKLRFDKHPVTEDTKVQTANPFPEVAQIEPKKEIVPKIVSLKKRSAKCVPETAEMPVETHFEQSNTLDDLMVKTLEDNVQVNTQDTLQSEQLPQTIPEQINKEIPFVPVAEPVIEPVVTPTAEPTVEIVVEPITETVIGPAFETVFEPIVETVFEPVVENIITPPVAEPITPPAVVENEVIIPLPTETQETTTNLPILNEEIEKVVNTDTEKKSEIILPTVDVEKQNDEIKITAQMPILNLTVAPVIEGSSIVNEIITETAPIPLSYVIERNNQKVLFLLDGILEKGVN